MKFTMCFVAALVLFSSFPVLTQKADAKVQQGASATASGSSVNQSSQANANAQVSASAEGTAEMRPVSGELAEKLDSKSAKIGDAVVVKTTQTAHTADGAVIPKGSRILGHVAEVKAHGKGSEDALLTVMFDRAELKGGQSIRIHSVIESVAPPVSVATSMDNEDSLAGGVGGMRSSGGGRTGGGLAGGAVSGGGSLAGSVGGVAGSSTRSLESSGNATQSGLASAGNGTLGAASQASGNATAATAGDLQAAAGGALAAHATGISGLMLAGDATGATSGTLSASHKNVHLDGGTQMVLGVSAAPPQ
jgi:hypothetical protein